MIRLLSLILFPRLITESHLFIPILIQIVSSPSMHDEVGFTIGIRPLGPAEVALENHSIFLSRGDVR